LESPPLTFEGPKARSILQDFDFLAQRTGNHWLIDDHEPYLRDKMTIGQFVTGETETMCPHHYNRNSNRFSNISKQLGSDIDVSIQDIYHYARRLSHSGLDSTASTN